MSMKQIIIIFLSGTAMLFLAIYSTIFFTERSTFNKNTKQLKDIGTIIEYENEKKTPTPSTRKSPDKIELHDIKLTKKIIKQINYFKPKTLDLSKIEKLTTIPGISPKLKSLTLKFNIITDEIFNEIAKAKNLQYLDLSGCELKFNINRLQELRNLKHLNLSDNSLPTLSFINKLKSLEVLNLNRTKITKEHIKDLKNQSSLKTIHLTESSISSKHLNELSKLEIIKKKHMGL